MSAGHTQVAARRAENQADETLRAGRSNGDVQALSEDVAAAQWRLVARGNTVKLGHVCHVTECTISPSTSHIIALHDVA